MPSVGSRRTPTGDALSLCLAAPSRPHRELASMPRRELPRITRPRLREPQDRERGMYRSDKPAARCRTVHPSKWRTPKAIPAHAPKLSATPPQRMIVERQSIEFMAPPMQAPMRYFLNMLPGSAEQQKCHMRFSPGYPRLPQDVERAAARLRGSREPEEQSDLWQPRVWQEILALDRSSPF